MNLDQDCPLCRSETRIQLVDKLDDDPRENTNYTLHRCDNCTLVFCIPFKSANSEHYQEVEIYSDRWEFKKVFEATGLNNSRILEIGCGEGHFILQANEYHNHVVGIDFNQQAITRANSKGLNANLMCIHADGLDESLKDYALFDMVAAFHVLEHLDDLPGFIEFCVGKLKPNGYLVLATPSQKRCSLLFSTREWWDRPPHHLTRWNERSFKEIAKMTNSNMTIISYQKIDTKKFHQLFTTWVYRNTLKKLGGRGAFYHYLSYVLRPLTQIIISLNSSYFNKMSGDTMLVILRKN